METRINIAEAVQGAREQLDSADCGAANQPSAHEPATRALVGIGYALLALWQEISFLRQTAEEVADRK